MQTRGYPVRVYQEDDGSWAAEVPDLPGCVAGGDDPDQLFSMLSDAIDEWIHLAEAEGAPVPEPTQPRAYSGRFVVRTPPSLHEQLAWRADQEGVSLNSLVLVALASYLAGPEYRAFESAPFRMPLRLDWDFESADVVVGAYAQHYRVGGLVYESLAERLTTGNQMEVTRSDELAAVQ